MLADVAADRLEPVADVPRHSGLEPAPPLVPGRPGLLQPGLRLLRPAPLALLLVLEVIPPALGVRQLPLQVPQLLLVLGHLPRGAAGGVSKGPVALRRGAARQRGGHCPVLPTWSPLSASSLVRSAISVCSGSGKQQQNWVGFGSRCVCAPACCPWLGAAARWACPRQRGGSRQGTGSRPQRRRLACAARAACSVLASRSRRRASTASREAICTPGGV